MSSESNTPRLSRILFAAACVVLALTCAMHLIATLSNQPDPPDDTGRQLMELFRTYKLEFPGTPRTLAEIMQGYSIHFAISLAGIALVGSAAVWGRPSAIRPVAAVSALLLAGMAANSVVYFFIIPIACLGLAAALFGAAALSARPFNTPVA